MRGSARRLWALVKKEFRQLLRDGGNLLIGIGLPIVLIVIFGFGLSLDIHEARLAVVLQHASPQAQTLASALRGTPCLRVMEMRSVQEAGRAMASHEAEAMLVVPDDFASRQAAGSATVQLLLNGGDPVRASGVRSCVEGALNTMQAKALERQGGATGAQGVQVRGRMWFNEANTSTWFLVPGLVVLIMTLVGTFLTALVMAREWERGTLESLFVTPVRPTEVLLAKIVPYFVVGMGGLLLCLVAARGLFGVPMRGSLWVLCLTSMLYMLVTLSIGLLISALTRNQFLASQVAILASFLPAIMLSGFVFDLNNVPQAIRIISRFLPPTYFMRVVKTLFLAGNDWPVVLQNMAVLALFATGLLGAARLVTRKRLD